MPTLWSAIAATAADRGAAPAVLWDEQVLTYGDLLQRSAEVANALAGAGVQPGDRVAVGVPNAPALVDLLLGVLRAGAVYVPLNPLSSGPEAAYIIEHSGARLVIAHDSLAQAVTALQPSLAARVVTSLVPRRGVPAAPPEVVESGALLVYTSGTTGRPKGALLAHRALLSNLRAVFDAWEVTADDRLLLTLPCSHVHGLGLGLLAIFLTGASVILRPRFVVDDVLFEIERYGATMFFGVPTMYSRIVQLDLQDAARATAARIRLWTCGSAPLMASTFERFQQHFGRAIVERYGMSEGLFMLSAPYRGARRAGVVGLPLPGVEVRLVDEDAAEHAVLRDVTDGMAGEIVVRGPNLFSEYWDDPEATRSAFVDGYFRTGDLALREADGMIRIVGRKSVDIIKVRGYKVSAVEIENCLQQFASVREVAVVGVPHPDAGEQVVAVVCPSAAAAERDGLLEHARRSLAPYKVPSQFVFADDIPKIGPGKFRKRELIDRLSPTRGEKR